MIRSSILLYIIYLLRSGYEPKVTFEYSNATLRKISANDSSFAFI